MPNEAEGQQQDSSSCEQMLSRLFRFPLVDCQECCISIRTLFHLLSLTADHSHRGLLLNFARDWHHHSHSTTNGRNAVHCSMTRLPNLGRMTPFYFQPNLRSCLQDVVCRVPPNTFEHSRDKWPVIASGQTRDISIQLIGRHTL